MPHKARLSLEPAPDHEVLPILQVANLVFIYDHDDIGSNIPFQLGLWMTSNIQCS